MIANYVAFIVAPIGLFVFVFAVVTLIDSVRHRLAMELIIYEHLAQMSPTEPHWELLSRLIDGAPNLEEPNTKPDSPDWDPFLDKAFPDYIRRGRFPVRQAAALAVTLAQADPTRLAVLFSESFSKREGAARRASRVVLFLQSNPLLRKFVAEFIAILGDKSAAALADELSALRARVKEAGRDEHRSLAEGLPTAMLNRTIAALVLVFGFVPMLLTIGPWCIYYSTKFHRYPFVITRRLGIRAEVFRYIEVRTFAPFSKQSWFGRSLNATGIYNYFGYLSVLAGKMSVVGTSPLCCFWPTPGRDAELRRFFAKPGMTGPAQLLSYKNPVISWDQIVTADVGWVDDQRLRRYWKYLGQSVLLVFRIQGRKDLSQARRAATWADHINEELRLLPGATSEELRLLPGATSMEGA